ncbi:hypothetical protein PENTCL1PPCAC_24364, partial [Pristionchus entomophagus]
KKKYYVGARQFPVPPCEDNGGMCKVDEDQKMNWFFFDHDNKEIGKVAPELWMDGEPGNQNAIENVAVLESPFSFDSYAGGLNDMNPEDSGYQPLCQFIDYLMCDNGYILIRDRCYKVIHSDPAKAADSKTKCKTEGGTLASVHDDAMNAIIIDFSRENTTVGTVIDKTIRFGLAYSGSEWINDDTTPVDFFRWWDQAGYSSISGSISGSVRAGLVVSGKARNPDPSYWEVIKDSDSYPFLCQKQPTQAYASA